MPSSSRLLSRRHALRLAAWGAAAVAAPWARASNPPANTTDTAATWRALSRLGYGPTPALIAQVQQAGGAQAWALAAIDAAFAASQAPIQLGGLPGDFDAPLPEIFERTAAERKARREQREAKGNAVAGPTAPPPTMTAPASAAPAAPAPSALRVTEPTRYIAAVARQSAAWKLLAASRPDLEHPLLARMSEFWFNHLNVSIDKGTVRPFAGHYQAQAIRGHALGRFEHLLLASARHPAMLYYLDQVQSVAEGTMQGPQRRGLNENYARELMELHTLGVNGGYTQSDVRELARVLTGWTVGPRQPDGFRFAPRGHDTGVKTVLGQRFGGNLDARAGEAEGVAAIRMLAAQPATARRLALRLAQWFVADQPPPTLVDQLARGFQASSGDLHAAMRTLVQSDAFWDPAQRLFKTPFDFACSTLAAAGGAQDERERQQALNLLQSAGQGVLRWPTPDGYKTDSATWLSPEALTRRADYAMQLARRNPPVEFLAAFAQPATLRRIDAQPATLRAGLLLASPDAMWK